MRYLTRVFLYTSMFASMVSGAVMADEHQTSEFKITLSVSKDTSTVITKSERVVFSVCSSTGIGSATITRRGQLWPASAIIRLYVSGLESFQVSNELAKDAVTLHAAISSHSGLSRIREWRNDDETVLLDNRSPYWMPVKLLDSQGHPATEIPNDDGCVELQLPSIFFANNPRKITLRWIDFYRG